MRAKLDITDQTKHGQINPGVNTTFFNCNAILAASWLFAVCGATTAGANGLQAELRSSAAILPALPVGMTVPTAPAGAVVIGAQPWVADASQGFTPVLNADATADPFLALSTGGLHLPIS